MGKNNVRFAQKIANPGNFLLSEIIQMAELLGVDRVVMADLIMKGISSAV